MGNELVKSGDKTQIRAGGLVQYIKDHSAVISEMAQSASIKIDPVRVANLCGQIVARPSEVEKFANCTNESFLNALKQCISYGLEPTLAKTYGYFVPYKGQLEYQLSYMGLIELARRCGIYTIAKCVFKGDKFEYIDGIEPKIEHVPDMTAPRNKANLVCAYCIAEWTDAGGKVRNAVEVMTFDEIEKARGASKTGVEDKGPWKEWYTEMARKTVLRRASKYWPLAPNVMESIRSDEANEFDPSDPGVRETVEAEVIDVETAKKPFTADVKAKMLDAIGAAESLDRTYQIEERFGAYDIPEADLTELRAAVKKQIELFNAFGA